MLNNIFLAEISDKYIYVSIAVGITVLILVCAIICFFILKHSKQNRNNIDNNLIDALILYLGSKSNIVSVEALDSRLKITVTDLDLVKLEELKTLTFAGIFVTGNAIKLMFKEDSKRIKEGIEKKL